MNVSSWSIRNPVPVILLFVLLAVVGVMGFLRLQIQDLPDTDLPTIVVSASLEGAAPSQLEVDVARKIEYKLTALTRLDHVTTTITDGAISISISFDIDKNVESALSEVKSAVDGARAELPAGMNAPTVSKLTVANSALLTYTVRSDRLDEKDLSWLVDNQLSKALLAVSGVASVTRVGGIDREVHVDLDPVLMAGLGVTPSDISRQLKAVQKDSSGGEGRVGGGRQSARIIATAGTADDIAAMSIPLTDGRRVRLDQVARVSDSHAERSTLAYLNGQSVVGYQIKRSRGFSDVTVAQDVRRATEQFAKAHTEVNISEAADSVTPIQENYSGSMLLLVEGALLAVVVVWCFLRDWRATLISAVALPLSILPAFAFMAYAGYALNTVTLLAISLVVGILVDDAIVEVENIERHLLMGKSPYRAAMDATAEVGLAVVATTLTLVAVFLPTAFMGGIPGKFFRQFGVTASIAVLASLLVARLLTPVMAAYLLRARAPARPGEADGRVVAGYLNWVRLTLTYRKTTAAACFVFLLGAGLVIPLIPTAFMPAQDRSQAIVTLKLAPGSTLEETAAISRRASDLVATVREVQNVFVTVGAAGSGGMQMSSSADVASATLTAQLVPREGRQLKQAQVEGRIRELLRALPGTRVSVGDGMSGQTLDITLAADDSQVLSAAAAKLEGQLRTLKGIGNVTSSAALQRPEIQVRPDTAGAAYLGVTTDALADAVRLATYGDYSTALPKLNLPERQIAIRVRMDPAMRSDIDAIGKLRVQGRQGMVALDTVAKVSLGSGPSQIDRLDRSRNIKLSVELNGRSLGEVQAEAMRLSAMNELPSGVKRVEQGDLQRMSEMMRSFGSAMAIGVFCIYAVLVMLFRDFLQPATILCALPLAVGGAIFSLWIGQQSFSMPVVIGLLMLMGIVTKNSILLVEYAIVARRERALSRFDAVMDACRKRARPIVMTTIAMAAGMLPNALGLGAEPSFRQPMAIVVIGGLMTSTVLSLLIVPMVFTWVDDLLQRGRTLLQGANASSAGMTSTSTVGDRT